MARRRKTTSKYQIVSFIVLLCILGAYFVFSDSKESTVPFVADGEQIYVHFIDVGQGDAALVQTKDGNLLIDAGTADSIDKLTAYIDALGIDSIVYAIFTHPHADHIGGAAALLEKYDFDCVILPDAVSTSRTFERMMEAIERETCEVIEGKAGVTFSLGETQVELLAPVFLDADDLNNASIVAKVSYGTVEFLFTGDAEKSSEADILDKSAHRLDSDILKVGHHGSSTSSSKDFLTAVTPEVAIISAGVYNEYGHPHAEVLTSLASLGTTVYRTDKCGDIVVQTDGNVYSIHTKK